jgi:uncharacterized DUF497 family protein
MVDLSVIEGFDWDGGNARKSLDRHGVTQAEAEQVFSNEPLLAMDVKHSQDEPRFHALGQSTEGRYLYVTFTLRMNNTKIRVISARDMNRKERVIYEQKT